MYKALVWLRKLVSNWVLRKLAEIAVKKTNKKYTNDLQPESILKQQTFRSNLAKSPADLQIVLSLRRWFFKERIIVPDSSYQKCWEINPNSMKIIYDSDNDPIGYWSIIPIDKTTFKKFTHGELSHVEMLTQKCLAWPDVNPNDCYLYIIGAVVPMVNNSGSANIHQAVSRRVIFDAFNFTLKLMKHLSIKGITGYPSEKSGYKVLKAMGLKKSEIHIDNNINQPVFFLEKEHINILKNNISKFTDQCNNQIPQWDSLDQDIFFNQLPNKR